MVDQQDLFGEQESQCIVCGTAIDPSMDKCPKCGWTWKIPPSAEAAIEKDADEGSEEETSEEETAPVNKEPVSAQPLEFQQSSVVQPPGVPAPTGQAEGPPAAALIIGFILCALILLFMIGKHS